MGRADRMSTKARNWEGIAKKIRFLLQNESITLDEMAHRIGVPREHLSYSRARQTGPGHDEQHVRHPSSQRGTQLPIDTVVGQ